jgi:hypothetical protein
MPHHPEPDYRGWHYFQGIEKQIKKQITMLFSPYHFPKRIVYSSIGTIMLIPSLVDMIRVKRVLNSSKYLHGKELMTIINKLKWNDPKLENFWPKCGTRIKPKQSHYKYKNKR